MYLYGVAYIYVLCIKLEEVDQAPTVDIDHTHTHLIPPWEDQCEWHRLRGYVQFNKYTCTHTHTRNYLRCRKTDWKTEHLDESLTQKLNQMKNKTRDENDSPPVPLSLPPPDRARTLSSVPLPDSERRSPASLSRTLHPRQRTPPTSLPRLRQPSLPPLPVPVLSPVLSGAPSERQREQ